MAEENFMGRLRGLMRNRADFEYPLESPDEMAEPGEELGIERGEAVTLDDSLLDALRFLNKKVEQLIRTGAEFPDEAIPEWQRLGNLQLMLHDMGESEPVTATPTPQFGEAEVAGSIPPL